MAEPVYWTINEAGSTSPSLEIFSPENSLHPKELNRWKGMHIPKRQREWFMGRLTAKRLLTAPGLPLHDVPLYQIEIDNQPEGAPYIVAPPPPGSLSISHREALAAAAYTKAPNENVGIDIEMVEPRAWSFVDDFFTKGEANHARSLPEPLMDIWATLAWSAKEAVLKVWQKGLRLDTRRVEILPVDAEQLGANPQDWQPLDWRANIEGFPDCWLCWRQRGEYVITLAGEENGEIPEIRRVEL